MDYPSFLGQGYGFHHQMTYNEDGGLLNNGVDHTQDIFDPSALFQTPHNAFRFEDAASIPSLHNHSLELGIPQAAETEPFPLLDLQQQQEYPDAHQSDSSTRQERRSSSDDTTLTPAQSKRKAQNRAAQRAFRERKEKHMKDIETKINALESSKTTLASDNQRLKMALQQLLTENDILRAASAEGGARPLIHMPASGIHQPGPGGRDDVIRGDPGAQQARKASDVNAGAMLTMPQVWDYIIGHPMVKSGRVDIAHTVTILRCSGSPSERGRLSYSEQDVRSAIERSRRAGGDALI